MTRYVTLVADGLLAMLDRGELEMPPGFMLAPEGTVRLPTGNGFSWVAVVDSNAPASMEGKRVDLMVSRGPDGPYISMRRVIE